MSPIRMGVNDDAVMTHGIRKLMEERFMLKVDNCLTEDVSLNATSKPGATKDLMRADIEMNKTQRRR